MVFEIENFESCHDEITVQTHSQPNQHSDTKINDHNINTHMWRVIQFVKSMIAETWSNDGTCDSNEKNKRPEKVYDVHIWCMDIASHSTMELIKNSINDETYQHKKMTTSLP